MTDQPKVVYFSNRCGIGVEVARDTYSTCGLLVGHDGPHEAVKVGKQTVSESPGTAATRREVRALECLDAIRLAITGAANDTAALMVIRTILADAPAPDRMSTVSVKRLLHAINRTRRLRMAVRGG